MVPKKTLWFRPDLHWERSRLAWHHAAPFEALLNERKPRIPIEGSGHTTKPLPQNAHLDGRIVSLGPLPARAIALFMARRCILSAWLYAPCPATAACAGSDKPRTHSGRAARRQQLSGNPGDCSACPSPSPVPISTLARCRARLGCVSSARHILRWPPPSEQA
jgi:hypothetical protein